jgi:hypothetical protein
MSSHTINYSSDAPEKVYYPLHNITMCHESASPIDAATKTALVLPEPMPFVLQTSLDDFYVLSD